MKHAQLVRRGLPDLKFFGNTFVAMSLAEQIPNSGIITPKQTTSHPKEWERLMLKNHGFSVHYVDYRKANRSQTPEGISKLSDEIKVLDYHFPESDLSSPLLRDAPLIFGKDVKQFMHLHCSSDFFLKGVRNSKVRTRLLQEAYEKERVKKFIAVSYAVRDSYLDILPSKSMEVVQNGIPENIYRFYGGNERDAFKKQFQVSGDTLLGYAGRLDSIKGYSNLVEIMSWFDKHSQYDIGFIIAASDGKHLKRFEDDLKKKAPRVLSENRVGLILDVSKYYGDQKEKNYFVNNFFTNHTFENLNSQCPLYRGISSVPLQAICDVYMQPSQSEGLPLSVIEATFCGTPVVASRVGGLHEIVSDATGTLIDPTEKIKKFSKDFSEGVVDLIESNYGSSGDKDTVEFRRSLREKLVPTFGSKNMAKKTREIYKS